MRFRLRTLLIVLAVLPPVLAFAWWASSVGFGPLAYLGAIGPTLGIVVVVNFCLDRMERWWWRQPPGST